MITELRARVEKATGADRELDGEIMFDLFAKPVGKMEDGGPRGYLWPEDSPSWSFGMRFPGKEREWFKPKPDQEKIVIVRDGSCVLMNSLRVPRLTESIDAAVGLIEVVLPGRWWMVGRTPQEDGQAVIGREEIDEFTAKAPTPALALIAAMLAALEAKGDGNG